MKQYIKTIDKKQVIKTRNNIVLRVNRVIEDKDGTHKEVALQVFNPSEEMILADGGVEFKAPEPTAEELLVRAKKDKIREIKDYDASSRVNEFYVQGVPIWLDKATRAGLKLRFEAEMQSGKTETQLGYNGIQYPLSVESAVQMLLAIELYASECYDNTQRHITRIESLETTDDLAAYDYTAGYPEKLHFTFE